MLLKHAFRAPARWPARMIRGETGASSVEYAIMASLVAAVIILAVAFLGLETSESFSCTGSKIASQGVAPC